MFDILFNFKVVFCWFFGRVVGGLFVVDRCLFCFPVIGFSSSWCFNGWRVWHYLGLCWICDLGDFGLFGDS